MELRHLRYFLTVADERQFTRAAARLHIQQPPLSQQIQELEAELGFAVFRRLPRGVELTPAGAAFAETARAVFVQLEEGGKSARRIANGDIGRVRIALTSSAAFHPLAPAAIRAFRTAHPDIVIELNEINAAEIIEAMSRGRIDAAMLRKPNETPGELRFDLLHEERMVLVLPVGHRLAHRRGMRAGAGGTEDVAPIALAALADESFIFVRRPGAPGMYADFVRACEARGFTPVMRHEVPRMLTAINLVATGAGVTVVPASMQRYHQESVVYCPVAEDQAFTAPLHLVTQHEAVNPAACRFARTVTDFAATWNAPTPPLP
ncbi:LysR substrate-binding domain-containing protein [Robbsia sp. Bb-Pol-6]|uniref:LysR substrate-binding domain-containing protein n=1 Tax=Robbsia betulipollinis TaxID=2981849 RepID=A0ABT3ZSW6_9BURK|nr:LysR substrate-binding domain-containing protein [Robbsia betulipollinis]MCY0389669.1 LysR substrate-binding domain-containing protein [Robbsia betulipollinis]